MSTEDHSSNGSGYDGPKGINMPGCSIEDIFNASDHFSDFRNHERVVEVLDGLLRSFRVQVRSSVADEDYTDDSSIKTKADQLDELIEDDEKGRRFEAAYQKIESFLEENPGYWPAKLRKGLICYELNKVEEAEMLFREIIALDENDHAASYGLFCTLLKTNQIRKAFAELMRYETVNSAASYESLVFVINKSHNPGLRLY